jgi:hypothetical protein
MASNISRANLAGAIVLRREKVPGLGSSGSASLPEIFQVSIFLPGHACLGGAKATD